jgi:hypothetical protein
MTLTTPALSLVQVMLVIAFAPLLLAAISVFLLLLIAKLLFALVALAFEA